MAAGGLTSGLLRGDTPVVGICGPSGVGKTSLLEAVLPLLRERGLAVLAGKECGAPVVFPDSRRDSDRLFAAGADVVVWGSDSFARFHERGRLLAGTAAMAAEYDLVLVEGHLGTEVPKLWLSPDGRLHPSQRARMGGELLAVMSPAKTTPERLAQWLWDYVDTRWRRRAVLAGLLIGGSSTRMGRPKHLLAIRGKTWAEHIAHTLGESCADVVFLGGGRLPPSLAEQARLPDAFGVSGPMAGLLAALRHRPDATWILCGCDQPAVSPECVRWLLSQRRPGVHAVMPRVTDARIEPLLALYEPQIRPALERLAASGCRRLTRLGEHGRVRCPDAPADLRPCWRNLNTPSDLRRFLLGQM